VQIVDIRPAGLEVTTKVRVSRCGDCGASPSASDLQRSVDEWSNLFRTCSFCGKKITLAGGWLKHFHDIDLKYHGQVGRGNLWELDAVEYEDQFQWMSSGPWGTTDIFAHTGCAKKECPYAEWKEERGGIRLAATRIVELLDGRTQSQGSLDDVAPAVDIAACTCGATPSPADIARVLQWARACLLKKCAYCGDPIKIERLQVCHFMLTGEHGRWCAKEWRIEPNHYWGAYDVGPISVYGHLRCARQALRYAEWRSR
jgi:hypothetical protein